jgi:L-ascorbate metabolism protein UlaG (beta-lactamase superfamily)
MALGRDTSITWHGHATVEITTPAGTRLLIDPFLADNPSFRGSVDDLARPDAILLTHGHGDHVADAAPLAARHGCPVIGMVEVVGWVGAHGAENTVGINKGGTTSVADVDVTMVHALHSSSMPDGSYGGEPAGLVLTIADGGTIYVAGDTDVFGDMTLIRELYSPDFAILPIGDFYTMGPRQAAHAIRLLGVRDVMGYHWGTFPVLTGTPEALREQAADVPGLTVHALRPGDSLT